MSDDKTHPHCPRCGGLPEWHEKHSTTYTYGCDDCGFGDPSGDTMYSPQGWRQAVRAELARQALEMRAHSARVSDDISHYFIDLESAQWHVMRQYARLNQHPISLPGEANDA